MALFIYGTLLHPPLMALIGGWRPGTGPRSGTGPGLAEPATLADHAVDRTAKGHLPMLIARPGAVARGQLWTGLDGAQLARLDAYETPFGYRLAPVTVRRADGTDLAAQAYFPDPAIAGSGEPWSLAEWEAAESPQTLLAAAEIAAHDPPLSGAALARQWPMIRHRASARLRAGQERVPATIRRAPGGPAPELLCERGRAGSFFKLTTVDLRYPTFAGPLSPVLTRDGFLGADAALVLPYDAARDRVLLVEQFRVGPFLRGDRNPWTLEPVAGLIEAGEEPAVAARREAREESGLQLQGLERMFATYASPGASTDHFHCFLGLADLPQDERWHGGLAEEHEDLRLHVLTLDAALGLIETGEINVGPLVAMLYWTARRRDRLTARRAQVQP